MRWTQTTARARSRPEMVLCAVGGMRWNGTATEWLDATKCSPEEEGAGEETHQEGRSVRGTMTPRSD